MEKSFSNVIAIAGLSSTNFGALGFIGAI